MKSVADFAKQRGLSTARIRLLCQQDRIPGAVKIARNWLVPDDATITHKQRQKKQAKDTK